MNLYWVLHSDCWKGFGMEPLVHLVLEERLALMTSVIMMYHSTSLNYYSDWRSKPYILLYYVIPIRVLDYYIRVSPAPIWQFNLLHNNNNKNFVLCKTHWLTRLLSGLATILHAQSFLAHFTCVHSKCGGIPQPLRLYGGSWYGVVSLSTYTKGFPFWEKKFKKKFGMYKNYIIPLGRWLGLVWIHVILYTYIEKVFII